MSSTVSRRSFLAGAASAGLAAGALMAGCTPQSATESSAETEQSGSTLDQSTLDMQWSFEIPTEPITDDQIKETRSAEIVIVGSGLSGLVTAVSAAEHGADVIVVSASSKPISRGGSNFAFGTTAQKEQGIAFTADDLRKHIKLEQSLGGNFCDAGKWSDWMHHSAEVMNWEIEKLTSKGLKVSIEPGMVDPDGIFTIQPAAHNFFNDEFPLGFKDGAPLQAQGMASVFTDDLGGTIYYNTPRCLASPWRTTQRNRRSRRWMYSTGGGRFLYKVRSQQSGRPRDR